MCLHNRHLHTCAVDNSVIKFFRWFKGYVASAVGSVPTEHVTKVGAEDGHHGFSHGQQTPFLRHADLASNNRIEDSCP